MRKARFDTPVWIDQSRRATVEIDRDSLVFTVRLFRRRRTFELPLRTVVEDVVWRVLKAESAEKRKKS